MAQTIALQRGTTTILGDGTTQGTLFTQSGGTATRVILNGVSAWVSTTTNYLKVGLFIKQNGSASNVTTVGIRVYGGANNYGNYDLSPGQENGKSVSLGTNTTASAITTDVLVYGNGAGSVIGSSGNTIDNIASWGETQSGNMSVQIINTIPQQFWMGPGDVLVMKVYDSNTRTHNVIYSFTTITES